jgi:hypothetical protein
MSREKGKESNKAYANSVKTKSPFDLWYSINDTQNSHRNVCAFGVSLNSIEIGEK